MQNFRILVVTHKIRETVKPFDAIALQTISLVITRTEHEANDSLYMVCLPLIKHNEMKNVGLVV
jgi:hypothetical protein